MACRCGSGLAELVDLLAQAGLPVEPGPGHSGRGGDDAEGDGDALALQVVQRFDGLGAGQLVAGGRRGRGAGRVLSWGRGDGGVRVASAGAAGSRWGALSSGWVLWV